MCPTGARKAAGRPALDNLRAVVKHSGKLVANRRAPSRQMDFFDNCPWEELPGSRERAAEVRERLRDLDDPGDAAERWRRVSREVLRPSDPVELHSALYHANYRDWDPERGPTPAVLPASEDIARSNLRRWLRELGMGTYAELHAFSVTERERFLEAALERLGIRFRKTFDRVLDLSEGVERPRWLSGARINIADSALTGAPDEIAIVFQKEDMARHPMETWSLGELRAASGRVASGLGEIRLARGDAVAVAMPMTAWAVAIYLGIVRAGMTVVSIADSFAAEEIATRLRIAKARVVFTQDVIVRDGKRLPMYEKVVAAGAGRAVVVSSRETPAVTLRANDLWLPDFLSESGSFETVACDPDDPINILFSSGTTGDPKAIPWDHTTPLRSALDGLVHQDIQPGDVVAWPTNLGWMMGPWLIFAALVNRAAIALYEGAPTTREFCRFVQDAGVSVLGLVPSLVRAWRSRGSASGLDWSRIKLFSSTGESSNSEDMLFLMSLAGYRPVIEYCGGTEVGGAYIASTRIQPNSPSCFSAKTLGSDLVVLDEKGRESRTGEVFLVPPAIGLSRSLLNQDHHAVYFEGCPRGPHGEILRRHGDEIEVLPGGYFRALGRADDTMNLAGIKVGSAELERVMSRVPGVVETAAVALRPAEGGPDRLVVWAVTEPGRWNDRDALRAAFQEQIRLALNPLFAVSEVVLIDRLPRTASNKVMRRMLRTCRG